MKVRRAAAHEWNLNDYIRHIRTRLEEKGVVYTPRYPLDAIIIAQILKWARMKGKSQSYLINRLDTMFENIQSKEVKSLTFMWRFFSEVKPPERKMKKLTRFHDTGEPKELTRKTQDLLRKMKKDLQQSKPA